MFGNMMLQWRPRQNLSVFGRLSYARAHDLVFPRGEMVSSGRDQWNLDISALFENVLDSKTDLSLSLRNLLDRQSQSPGTYEMISTDPFAVEVVLRKKWK
jgi:hypothetical protein